MKSHRIVLVAAALAALTLTGSAFGQSAHSSAATVVTTKTVTHPDVARMGIAPGDNTKGLQTKLLAWVGNLDGHVLAYDASTGKELWRQATGKAIGGGVISYDAGGKQYIAAATGLNAATWMTKAGPARVVVYALP